MTARCLFIQTRELRAEHRALPLTQTIVRTVNVVAVKPLTGHTSAIVDGARQALDFIVIRNNHAAFAGGHQLAGLETERPCGPERSYAPSAPFAAVRV